MTRCLVDSCLFYAAACLLSPKRRGHPSTPKSQQTAKYQKTAPAGNQLCSLLLGCMIAFPFPFYVLVVKSISLLGSNLPSEAFSHVQASEHSVSCPGPLRRAALLGTGGSEGKLHTSRAGATRTQGAGWR